MSRLKKQKIIRTAGTATLLGILLMALMSCKSPSSPEEDLKAYIHVNNTCGAAVDIFMNDAFNTLLENDSSTTIEVVTEGIYLLGAYKTGTEILVFFGQVEVFLGGNYNWDIEGPCEIIVTNNYGETLQIHLNGTYLGDLDDSYSETISKVTFGEHTLEAKKPITGEVVASTTFDLIDVGNYFWEITNTEENLVRK